jgi:hypothetical protein
MFVSLESCVFFVNANEKLVSIFWRETMYSLFNFLFSFRSHRPSRPLGSWLSMERLLFTTPVVLDLQIALFIFSIMELISLPKIRYTSPLFSYLLYSSFHAVVPSLLPLSLPYLLIVSSGDSLLFTQHVKVIIANNF